MSAERSVSKSRTYKGLIGLSARWLSLSGAYYTMRTGFAMQGFGKAPTKKLGNY